MIQEENIIRQHDSGRRPFATPDGYFESFTDRLMTRICEEEVQQAAAPVVVIPLWRKVMRYAAAAAVAVCCLGGATVLYDRLQTAEVQLPLEQMEMAWDEQALDDALDYEMLDNQQIAYYLTEAY